MKKVYETVVVVTGDAKGGLKAIRLTREELENLKKGLESTTKANSNFRKSMNQTSAVSRTLKQALGAVTAVSMVKYLTSSADAMKNIDAKLRIVTNSTREYAIAQDELKRISLETFSNIDTTSRLYTRMQQSLKDISVTQRDLLTVTQATNQAFMVSGATAHEASAAIIQMTQALASGQLRGEEFRSVSEQATRILQVLQDELGKTRGELILMAHSGQLTSELVIDAMLNQSGVLKKEAAELPVTVERAIQNMDTHFKTFIQQLENTTNATGIVAKGIELIGENLDVLATFVASIVAVKMVGAIAKIVGSATAMVKSFGRAKTVSAGLTGAVGKLNKSLRLVGGAWGIALFAGIGFIEWMLSAQEEIDLFSDKYKQSMDEVKKATEDGLSVADIPVFRQSIASALNEIVNLQEQITRLNEERQQGQANRAAGPSGGVRAADRIVQANSQISDATRGLEAADEQMNQLRDNFEQSISTLKRLDENFGFVEEALARYTFAVNESGTAQGLWNTLLFTARSAADAMISTQESANSAIEEWSVSTIKQIETLEEQIATFGMSKEQVLIYRASLIDTTGATAEMKKAQEELLDKLKQKVKVLEDLNEEKEKEKKLEKEKLKRDRERQQQVEEILKDFERDVRTTQASLDPMNAALQEWGDKTVTALAALATGEATIFEVAEALKLYNQELEKNKDKIETQEKSFQAMVRALEQEIAINNANGDAKLALIATRELENKGIEATIERVQKLVALYKEEAKSAGAIGNFRGVFDSVLGNIGGSLSDTLSGIGTNLVDMFQQDPDGNSALGIAGFATAGIGAFLNAREAGLDAGGGILRAGQAVLAMIPGWGQAIAAVMEVVDQLAGGKLFGTAFEATGGSSFIGIDQTGGSGFTETDFARQRSFFRGTERRTDRSDLTAEAQAAVDELFATINSAVAEAAGLLGADIGDIITGQFEQEFDKDGNLVREFSTILGRTFEETFEQFSQRILAENLIGVIDSILPQVESTFTRRTRLELGDREGLGDIWIETEVTQMVGQATAIAERWRGNAETLLEGAQFLTAAAANFVNGTNIFETLEAATNFVEANANANENLTETYERVLQANSLWSQGLEQIGVDIGLTGEAFIQFAVDVAEAAGSVQNLGELLSGYFEGFYTEAELQASNIQSLYDTAITELSEIGLGDSLDAGSFRSAFEEALATLAPEDVVEWLEAGNALAAINAELEALAGKEQDYIDFINGFRAGIAELTGTDFQQAMAGLEQQNRLNIQRANELAVAAGRSGAATEDLAAIQQLYAAQAEALIARLRQQTINLIDQLYGDDLDAQIADLENNQVNSIANVGNAAQSMYEDQLRAVQNIATFMDSLLLNEQLSPLSRTEQLAEAMQQWEETLAAAQAGDVDAMNALPDLAQTLLGIARDVFASGTDYTEIFDQIFAGLGSVGVTLEQPGTQNQNVTVSVSSELQALYEQREARDQQLYAQQRLELATQLAAHLNDLATALNQPLFELAEELGLSMNALVTDLGVNLEDVTATTATQLATISNMLGVNLSELANQVGFSLGELTDEFSVVNDALEQQIALLPTATAANLQPFLNAIEQATNEADANAAIAAMEEAIQALPAEERNLLAPFFENIEYQSEFQQQIAIMEAQEQAGIDSVDLLNRILTSSTTQQSDVSAVETNTQTIATQATIQSGRLASIDSGIQGVISAIGSLGATGGNTNSGPQPPQFFKGVRKIQKDQVAKIHKGETVLPADLVRRLDDFGLPIATTGPDQATVTAMKDAIVILTGHQREMKHHLDKLTRAIVDSNKQSAAMIANSLTTNRRTNHR